MTEPDPSDIEIPEEEVSGDSTTVIVTDSENYSKTQKLKAIQEAKDHYKSFSMSPNEKYKKIGEAWANPEKAMKHQEAKALAMYGSELLPLIEEGLEKGALSEDDLKVETNRMVERLLDKSEMDIREVVELQGRIWANNEKQALPQNYQKRIYRQFERIERKLGLGPDLEIDKGPAQI